MRFLVAYNGSKEAKSALALARGYAKLFHAKIIVMTSMEGGAGEKADEVGKAEYELNWARNFLLEEGIECEVQSFARGLLPGEDIVRYVEENGVDQVYVGIEKKSKTRKLFMGSTAQYVILKAPCPVICVK
ncbi:MAG TPA: universal stress protein [Desulfobacterales bacterium]|jgi:nucleotide-binding universal stress UspA family protein|nr:universal stress protein [Desulfobacterales bacterium]